MCGSKYGLLACCLVFVVALAGCGPAVAPPLTPTVLPAATATATLTPSPVPPTATSTSTPTSTPIPVSVFEMPDMLVTVSFVIPEGVASGGEYTFVPYGSQYEKKARLQNILPRYGQVTLQNYPQVSDSLEASAIRIFTVTGLADRFRDQPIAVQNVLNGDENVLAKLPTFPNLEVAALQTRLVNPIEFKTGRGFRYVNFEIYTEQGNPIPRASVSYIFQGLTSDNKFYVSVILPIDLPPVRQKAQEILLKAIANPTPQPMESYYPEILPIIEQAADEAFIPNLALLDELIRSMDVVGR